MKQEQFEKLMEAVAQNTQNRRSEPVEVKHDIIDILSKFAVALCTSAVIYVASQMGSLTTDMAVMKAQMSSFTEFTKAPRFTEENNNAADQKLLGEMKTMVSDLVLQVKNNSNEIQKNSAELTRRSDFIASMEAFKNETDKRLNKIDIQLQGMGH